MSIIMDKLSKKGYSINYTDEVISALLDKGVDTVKGARGLAQVRREKMEDQLADILIKSAPPRGTIFEISYKDSLFQNQLDHIIYPIVEFFVQKYHQLNTHHQMLEYQK